MKRSVLSAFIGVYRRLNSAFRVSPQHPAVGRPRVAVASGAFVPSGFDFDLLSPCLCMAIGQDLVEPRRLR
jgi:hypothetical protein